MELPPPPSVMMPMVTADCVAGSGVSADAAPAVPTPTPTTVADRDATVIAATPSMLRPMTLGLAAVLVPPRRVADRPIEPDVSTLPPWGSGGAKCARSALASPPDATAKRGYRLPVPVVNILQHISKWLAGQVNFFGFPRAGAGGLVRLFSFRARDQSPSSPGIATAPDPFRRTGTDVSCEAPVPDRRCRPWPSPWRSFATAPNKNRTLFITSAIKVLQRQQPESSPRQLTALVSLRRKGPPRRPGHGRGCAGPGNERRGPSARSTGLACPRCGRGGRPSGSTCRPRGAKNTR